MNACGLLVLTACMTTTPGTPDPLCPDVVTPLGSLPGCCSVTGVCGGEVGAPLGCNDLSAITGGSPTPCGPDAAPPPPRDSGTDTTQPPADTGPGTDTGGSDTGGNDTGGSDTGGNDTGGNDGSRGDASDGGGASDASGDQSG
jgi:hypothetical protein